MSCQRQIHYRETEIKRIIKDTDGKSKKKRENIKARVLLFNYYVVSNMEEQIISYGAELKEFLNNLIKESRMKEIKEIAIREWNETMKIYARYDFETYNEYIEFLMPPEKKFYGQRKNNKAFQTIVKALNDSIMKPNKYDLIAISMPPRTGKALKISEPVVTPEGYKPIGNIKVGDLVATPKGTFTKVLGVYPQGKKDIYRIWFDNEKYIDCEYEHLWEVKTRDDRRRNKSARVIKTGDMLKNYRVESGKRANYSISKTKPVMFPKKELNINPYVMGIYLGDGYCGEKSLVTICNSECDIIQKFVSLLSEKDNISRKSETEYNIVSNGNKSNLKKGLEYYNLVGKRSYEKFIPREYLLSNVEDRLELLRGLIDTDGYVSNNTIEYSTTSYQLAQDVKFLCESLGGNVTIKERMGRYKKNNIEKETRLNYRVYIMFDNGIVPVSSKKHLKKYKVLNDNKDHFITKIEKLNEQEETVCIYVEDDNHLFLTNHFIPTHNTQIGIRFLSWVGGKFPESSNLGISCTNTVTSSFYSGIMEIVKDDERYRYNEVFPNSKLINQDAKDNLIWLGRKKRYQTLAFKSVGAGIQGAFEAEKVLYCDDMVEGYETAISIDRLDKLWELYLSNIINRKKTGCVEIHIGTRWSIHDPIGRLERQHRDNPRYKFIKFPALDENDKSNFMYEGGFSTDTYREIRRRYTEQDLEVIWRATYQNEPIERDGTVFDKNSLHYFYNLPDREPDAKICVIDSKNQGKDNVACAILYNYDQYWYFADAFFSSALPDITTIEIAKKIVEHKIPLTYCESNNGGEYFAEKVNEEVKKMGFETSIVTFFTSSNKITRIITQAPFIKEYFLFKAHGTYKYNTYYWKFMDNVFEFNQKGTAKHDDAPDVLSLASQQIQYISTPVIEVGDRRKVGI